MTRRTGNEGPKPNQFKHIDKWANPNGPAPAHLFRQSAPYEPSIEMRQAVSRAAQIKLLPSWHS